MRESCQTKREAFYVEALRADSERIAAFVDNCKVLRRPARQLIERWGSQSGLGRIEQFIGFSTTTRRSTIARIGARSIRHREYLPSIRESITCSSTAGLTRFSSFIPRNPSFNSRSPRHENAAHHDNNPPLPPLSHRLSKPTSSRRTHRTIHIRPPCMCLELRSSLRCPRQMRTSQHPSR